MSILANFGGSQDEICHFVTFTNGRPSNLVDRKSFVDCALLALSTLRSKEANKIAHYVHKYRGKLYLDITIYPTLKRGNK